MWTPEQIKEYIEAILDEQRRGMVVAEQERDKSAQALTRERRDAAQALATAMSAQMDRGDENLRSHIDQQIAQIREALDSANELEIERIRTVTARLDTQFMAAQEAILKSEKRYDDKFEQQNEWRGQSADRERSQQETIAKLSGGFLPREVAEAQMADLRQQIGEVKEIAQSARDQRAGRVDAREGMSRSSALGIAALSAAAAVVGILVTVVLAANGVLG